MKVYFGVQSIRSNPFKIDKGNSGGGAPIAEFTSTRDGIKYTVYVEAECLPGN